MIAQLTPDDELADAIATFWDDPLGFVMFAYEWGSDPQLQVVRLRPPWSLVYACEYGPDAWACEFLDDIGRQVRKNNFNPLSPTPVAPIRESVASGHGIGKSALTAWLVDWIMSTRPYAKGVVSAGTAEQLSSRTWAEIASWTRRCITGHWFNVTTGKGSMKMEHRQHPDSWKCIAQTCKEENSDSFAGQHAVTSTSFYIFDEAAAIPDKIEEVSEGGMTDGEPMKFAFGNPTINTGWFANTFKAMRHRWGTRQIDSRDVQITNKKLYAQWVEDYGIDSDFVKTRVRGMFPNLSARQFISVADVDAAFGRHLAPNQYQWAPKILTVDPAWEGDDEMVIGIRQGLKFDILRVIPKNDNDFDVAVIIANLEDEHKADAVFIDAGYGTGIVSAGKVLMREWQLVWFSGQSTDPGCLNKRAQMWKDMRDWMKDGGAIPLDHVLYNDLVGPQVIGRSDGLIQLESKRDMKGRGLPSPGRGDCLAISFAFPVRSKDNQPLLIPGPVDAKHADYDPYEHMKGHPHGGSLH